MRTCQDLSKLDWKLSGWIPHLWRIQRTMEIGASPAAEIHSIPARVPGSVQMSLRDAGLLPDWNVGLNFRDCEWVENRHWIYETAIPDEWIEPGRTIRLKCLGLDYRGWVMLNGEQAGGFEGSHTPHTFDLTPRLRESGNLLRIVFDTPPRWLGQFGYTSQMTEWKTRFNYTWDWTPRLVQTGISDAICLEISDGREIEALRCSADFDPACSTGMLSILGEAAAERGASVVAELSLNGNTVVGASEDAREFNRRGLSLEGFGIEPWWPNLEGGQPLYDLVVKLVAADGGVLDSRRRRIGFRNIACERCEGAIVDADPWVCVVNGRPMFLQGVNWTPILPDYADAAPEQYRKRLELYKDMGVNILRVWGGASLERECFYDMCDELGLMVWQEFPLSSSGIDNWPPEDQHSVEQMAAIARSYIERRQHHASLILWCGGNELQCSPDGSKKGGGRPCDFSHPMLRRLREITAELDPNRRFLPTSSSGPRFSADPGQFGQGIHWDVHGPWKAEGDLDDGWTRYWNGDDAMFRSETGAPGASPAQVIRRSAGSLDPMPPTAVNPLWRRTSTWWIEHQEFLREMGREPESLEEYVEWSQQRQKRALVIAAKACKGRFPRCGGFIVWMGHDCFPCTANTSVVDVDGNPKPAALGLKAVFRGEK